MDILENSRKPQSDNKTELFFVATGIKEGLVRLKQVQLQPSEGFSRRSGKWHKVKKVSLHLLVSMQTYA